MDLLLSLTWNEEDLVRACIRQERWAQQKVYEDHYGRMMGICQRYASREEESLDLLHEGFMKVFRSMDRYRPGTSLEAWIRTVMVNTCIDHFRRAQRHRTEELEEAKGLTRDDPTVLDSLSAEEILDAVRQLSPGYRMVFNLFVLEGFSHKEIGEMLHITESTSRSNLVKARMKLQEILTGKSRS